jgi:tight adherence protein B
MVLVGNRDRLLVTLAAVGLLLLGTLLRGWVLGIGLAGALVAGALWWAQTARARRRDLLERQLVPALRTMAAAAESGLTIHQALERLVRDSPPPIAGEFAQVLRAVDLGVPMHAALGDLAARTGSVDFEFFAAIVTVQTRTGGSLASLLTSLANNIQERVEFKAEVGALTAQARYSGWVLAALPFLVVGLLLVASPNYVAPLFSTGIGRLLLILAAGLLALGLVIINMTSNVEI